MRRIGNFQLADVTSPDLQTTSSGSSCIPTAPSANAKVVTNNNITTIESYNADAEVVTNNNIATVKSYNANNFDVNDDESFVPETIPEPKLFE